jgi:hypothetical protein
MKKRPKNKIATACANVMFFFDENSALGSTLFGLTEKEHRRICETLKKDNQVNPDDLMQHEVNVRDIAFAAGYFLGTGQLVMNSQAEKALQILKRAWLKTIDMPPGLKE